MKSTKKSGIALIPFLVFIVVYLGAGLIYQARGEAMAFYMFPSVTAMFLAVLVAFCMGKGSISEKFEIFAKGAGNVDVLTMLVIYMLAGAFANVAGSMGAKDATVNLGLALVPPALLAAGLFVIAAFFGTATGTSMGTISALIPIAIGVAEKGNLSTTIVIAAVVGGGMFGDNLSMISDTTIAATRSQRVEMRDKFRVNFLIALPAAVITLILLLVFGRPESAAPLGDLSYNILKIVPYLAVLGLALCGLNVFAVLVIGIFAAGIIGILTGSMDIAGFAQAIYDGFCGMNEVFFSACDCATANNTVAIIVAGDMAREVSHTYKVDPRRTASLLDIFSCVFQGVIPYGAQLVVAASLATQASTTGQTFSAAGLVGSMWYCWILAVFGLLSIFIPFADGVTRKNPWNWEYDCPESEVAAKKAAQAAEADA